eukprot:1160652-Pelagomonas_calceolata.AAC.11
MRRCLRKTLDATARKLANRALCGLSLLRQMQPPIKWQTALCLGSVLCSMLLFAVKRDKHMPMPSYSIKCSCR